MSRVMHGTDLIRHEIERKIPGSTVTVERGVEGYVVSVVAEKFCGMRKVDREAAVYESFGRLPLTLLAKIVRIETTPV